MTEELKSCPFCGSDDVKLFNGLMSSASVNCWNCFTEGPMIKYNNLFTREEVAEKARAAWNERV